LKPNPRNETTAEHPGDRFNQGIDPIQVFFPAGGIADLARPATQTLFRKNSISV
jgi:hypothetical protein